MRKYINGWEGLYDIDEFGIVRNSINNKILTGDINSSGYKRVCLYRKGHEPYKQRIYIAREVAKQFIPNPKNKPEVNHKDHNTLNNHVSNLEWVTKKENELDSRMYGSKEYKPFYVIFSDGSDKYYRAKSELSDQLGITKGLVSMWLHGKSNTYENYGIFFIKYCNFVKA